MPSDRVSQHRSCEYDRTVGPARAGGSLEDKKRVLSLIDEIDELSKAVPKRVGDAIDDLFRAAPAGIEKTRALLLSQVRRLEGGATAGGTDPAEQPT